MSVRKRQEGNAKSWKGTRKERGAENSMGKMAMDIRTGGQRKNGGNGKEGR